MIGRRAVSTRLWLTVGAILAMLVLARPAAADVVTDWNRIFVDSLVATNAPPPASGRLGATVQGAVYDAVNGVTRRYTPLHVTAKAPKKASRDAAAVEAAYRTLSWAFPSRQAVLDAARADSLAAIDDSPKAIQAGIAWGASVAAAYIQWRSGDGFDPQPPPYTGSTAIGAWRPTPPAFAPGAFPQLGATLPFALADLDDYRAPGPPALATDRYAAEFNEVLAIGGTSATTEGREIAFFWRPNSVVIWNDLALDLVDDRGSKVPENARTFALLNATMADATRAGWREKYTHVFWRAITANEFAAEDGNTATERLDGWNTVFATPNHPDYPSGHATLGGAAATALASVFGDALTFSMTTIDPSATVKTRTYTSLSAAGSESGDSRVYGGVHFRSAGVDGETLGRAIGAAIAATAFRPVR